MPVKNRTRSVTKIKYNILPTCRSCMRMLSPVSATLRMVCLKAQMMESRTSLNCCGGIERKAGKQW